MSIDTRKNLADVNEVTNLDEVKNLIVENNNQGIRKVSSKTLKDDINNKIDKNIREKLAELVKENEILEIREQIDANSITTTVSGETITITDSAKTQPKSIKLFGKTTQPTTKGNQLFDGTIENIVGIAEGVFTSSSLKSAVVPITGSETYTISIRTADTIFTSTTSEYPAVQIPMVDIITGTAGNKVTNKTVTTSENAKYLVVGFGSGIDPHTSEIMVNIGTTALPLEQYTGNKPSPSLNYPQELNHTGANGNVNQAFLSHNLYNIYDKLPYNFESCIIDSNDWCSVEYDNSNGNDTHYVGIQVKPSKYLKPNTEYLIVTETEYISGCDFYSATGMEQASTQGQFNNTPNCKIFHPGIQISKITTRNNFIGCVTMLRSIIAVNPGDVCKLKYRISVLADLTITTDTFAYGRYKEQSFIVSTPNGFPGLPLGQTILDEIKNSPIHMGGVYHDGEQYWIGDTKDYSKGKNVQRILKGVLDGSTAYGFDNNEIWHLGKPAIQDVFGGEIMGFADLHGGNNPSLSNYFITQSDNYGDVANELKKNYNTMCILGNGEAIGINAYMFPTQDDDGFKAFFTEHPTEIYAIAKEPIITDLTEEEITQYNSLNMNYPNTTVTNDSGAYMELEYTASPKEYIAKLEKKHDEDIQQLKNAIIALGGTV